MTLLDITKIVSNLYKANIWSNSTIEFSRFGWDSDRWLWASPQKLVYNNQRNHGTFTNTRVANASEHCNEGSRILKWPLQGDAFHSNIPFLVITFRKHKNGLAVPIWMQLQLQHKEHAFIKRLWRVEHVTWASAIPGVDCLNRLAGSPC